MSDLKQSFPSAPIIEKRELTPDPSLDFTDWYLGDFAQQQKRSRPPNEGLKSPAFTTWYLGDFAPLP